MKYDLITVGGATEDIVFYTDAGVLLKNQPGFFGQNLLAFPADAKIIPDKIYHFFGGGAANIAVGLRRLGFKTAPIISLGNDERGDKIIANFKNNKVERELITRASKKESGFSLVLMKNDVDRIIFAHRGANDDLKLTAKHLTALKNTKNVHISSLTGDWKKILTQICAFKNLMISWNPGNIQLRGGHQPLDKYLQRVDILLVNEDEARELVLSSREYKHKGQKFFMEVKNLLAALKSFGPKLAVITRGVKGAVAYDGKKFYQQSIVKGKKREDTTGVGDAFNTGFLAGLKLFNNDISQAMHLGMREAALVVSHLGAQNNLLFKKSR